MFIADGFQLKKLQKTSFISCAVCRVRSLSFLDQSKRAQLNIAINLSKRDYSKHLNLVLRSSLFLPRERSILSRGRKGLSCMDEEKNITQESSTVLFSWQTFLHGVVLPVNTWFFVSPTTLAGDKLKLWSTAQMPLQTRPLYRN